MLMFNKSGGLFRNAAGAPTVMRVLVAIASSIGAVATAQRAPEVGDEPVGKLVGASGTFFFELSPMTGEATPVSELGLGGFRGVEGLAFDPNTNTLYGSDIESGQLIILDPATGLGTAVGPLGFSGVRGLAFDPNTNTLFGTARPSAQLITIDPATGHGTAVGPLGFYRVEGLAFDPNTNTLYGADRSSDQLITIDPATGAGTAVGSLIFSLHGLAFDANTNTLFGVSSTLLITIDPATGTPTISGGTPPPWGV